MVIGLHGNLEVLTNIMVRAARPAVAATKKTTISLRKGTQELLRRMSSKGQTYDQIIRDLIERASIKKLEARWNRILKEKEFIPLDELGGAR